MAHASHLPYSSLFILPFPPSHFTPCARRRKEPCWTDVSTWIERKFEPTSPAKTFPLQLKLLATSFPQQGRIATPPPTTPQTHLTSPHLTSPVCVFFPTLNRQNCHPKNQTSLPQLQQTPTNAMGGSQSSPAGSTKHVFSSDTPVQFSQELIDSLQASSEVCLLDYSPPSPLP